MKVRGERGRSALYIGCVYIATDGSGTATIDDSYDLLKEDVLTFKQKGKVVLLKREGNQLYSIISNRNINLTAQRLLLLSLLRPSMEYGSEVWKCNKSQASALESILLGGAKKILGGS